MKKLNTTFNGTLNYVAGISSPTAANLSVQGLTETNPTYEQRKREEKHERTVKSPFSYLAGVSSPTAGNVAIQGLTPVDERNYQPKSEPEKSGGILKAIVDGLSTPNPVTCGPSDPHRYHRF